MGKLNLNSVKDLQGNVQYSIGVIQVLRPGNKPKLALLAAKESIEIKSKETPP